MNVFEAKPVNVQRTKLIERIDHNLAEERRKRDEAQKANKAAQDAVAAFIRENAANLAGWFYSRAGGGWGGTLEDLQGQFDPEKGGHDHTPKEQQPSTKESELEKLSRVLKMASDDSVEVYPDQAIYRLL